MKIKNIFLLTALIRVIFIFSACDDLDGSRNQGSIVISFGDSTARAVSNNNGNPYSNEADKINTYTITLTGQGTIKETVNRGGSVSIPVTSGKWSVLVKGEGDRVIVSGKEDVRVAAGQTAKVPITMNITGTRVSDEDEIKADFDELNKGKAGKLAYLEEIEILKGFDISVAEYKNGITLNSSNTVTVWAEEDVTLKRSDHYDQEVDATVFRILKGTLILDGTKGGEITIDGNKDNNTGCIRALVNVIGKDSALTITEGITLKNNKTDLGGGVYVEQGTFRMEGGIITGNNANNNGGGVYVKDNGTFIKTSGIIYGSDDRENMNSANGNGDAVYYNNKAYNNTSSANDKTFAPK